MRNGLAFAALVFLVGAGAGCFDDVDDIETGDGSTGAGTGDTMPSGTTTSISGTATGPTSSTGTGTTTTSGSGSVGTSTTADTEVETAEATDSTAESSTTGTPMCAEDPYEPNDVEGEATELPDIVDGDDPFTIDGVLEGELDADWYSFHVADEALAFLEPVRALDRDGPVRLCKFFRCDVDPGNTTATCTGTDEDVLLDGTPGCCTDGEDLAIDVECVGGDDGGTLTIRLEPQTDECVTYTLSYGA